MSRDVIHFFEKEKEGFLIVSDSIPKLAGKILLLAPEHP
jgi:hypothetical protein